MVAIDKDYIYGILDEVLDPEVPVLSITDLGIVRDVAIEGENIIVTITPTYSGCPAMNAIEQAIMLAFAEAQVRNIQLKTVLAPAWTTDWITDRGIQRLKEYGIAPPEKSSSDKAKLSLFNKTITCPQCGSETTELISQFGSTACKAQYRCTNCMEPFEYFKCF